MRHAILILLSAVLALACMTPSEAMARKPRAYMLTCLMPAPAEAKYICGKEGSAKVRLTDSLFQDVARVNKQVNRSIRVRKDPPGTDIWTLGARSGDCEDFAIAKRKLLIDAGVPSKALRFRSGWLRGSGVGHVVLTMKTDRGTFVLDILSKKVRRLEDTEYRNWTEL